MKHVIYKIILIFFIISGICTVSAQARERKWKVKRVEFLGNTTFARVVLLSRMELKQPVLFSSTVYTEYKLRSDIAALERFYRSQGFLDVSVDKGKVFRDSSRNTVTFSILIKEGTRYTVNAVSIESENNLNDASLYKTLKTKAGNPLITALIDEDISKISERFRENGYLYVKITPDVILDSLNYSVAVRLRIVEGPVIYVDSIHIIGNKSLKERVIRRELEFKKKEKLTIGNVQKSERRLYRSNLFSYVRIDPVLSDTINRGAHPVDTTVPVEVSVDEADFFKIEAGAGYGTADGLRGSLTTSYGNLFGIGHKVSLLGNLSQKQQEIEGRYGVPWFLVLPIRCDVGLYMRNRTDEKNTYDALLRGLEFTAGQQTDFNFAYRLWLQWEDVSRLSNNPDEKNTQSIGLDLVWDTRNDLINPDHGTYNQLKIKTAGLTDKRSNEFVKFTTDSRFYWKTGRIKCASGLRMGWSTTFGTTDSLPLQERFFGGGSRSVRGFKEGELRKDSLGGEVRNLSGTTSIIANIFEIRLPIIWWFEGALFTDAGYIWIREMGESLTLHSLARDIRWTAGGGLRLNTPVAVVRFDTGVKLNRLPGERRVEFHVDIGNSF